MLVGLLGIAGPVWGHVLPETPEQQQVGSLSQVTGRLIMVFSCKLRSPDWFAQRAVALANTTMTYARAHVAEIGGAGGRVGAEQFVYGAGFQAANDAAEEFARYGQIACRRLRESEILPTLDGLLK